MRSPVPFLSLTLAGAALAAAGCGGSGDGTSSPPPPQPKPTAQAEDFPTPRGDMTVQDLTRSYPDGPIFAPSVQVLKPGSNRVGFALFDRARKQLNGAGVAVYVAKSDGTGVRGPFLARSESLAVKPQYTSRQSAQDADSVQGVYVASVPFTKQGKPVVMALARIDGRILSTSPQTMVVGSRGATPPDVGEKAITIHTLTPADVGGDLRKIDTRTPPAPGLLKDDFADVVGKKPVVLTFATPQLCQSRVCGPVTDIVEQVRAQSGGRGVSFIHQEIYKDNELAKGVRPQVAAWHLASEPWTFVIDRSGRIATRFEGAFSAGELQRAVAKVQ